MFKYKLGDKVYYNKQKELVGTIVILDPNNRAVGYGVVFQAPCEMGYTYKDHGNFYWCCEGNLTVIGPKKIYSKYELLESKIKSLESKYKERTTSALSNL